MPRFLALLLLFATLVLAPLVNAQDRVIPAGREDVVSALFEPYFSEPVPGWTLAGVSIEPMQIVATVEADSGAVGTLTLVARGFRFGDEALSESFAMTATGEDPVVQAATALLIERVTANDNGGVWAAPTTGALGVNAIATVQSNRSVGVFLCVLFCLGLVLVRQLKKTTWRVTFTLLGITVLGAVVRLWLSQPTVHGAWPYSRTQAFATGMWNDPLMLKIAGESAVWLYMDFQMACGFIFAVVTPLAVYCHGSQLLQSFRAGLFAALIIALLPMHIRFSLSEVAFIPSIVLSSLSFALLHSALKEEVLAWRWLTALALVPVSYIAFTARPLNIIFAVLLVYTTFVLVPRTVPMRRKIMVSTSLAISGTLSTVLYLLEGFKEQVRGGADPVLVIGNTFRVLFSFEHNTLIRPDVTPIFVTALAVFGVWAGWQGNRRRAVIFLVGWWGMFLSTHSIIMPEVIEMTARYHLHIIVPAVLLAGLGADELSERCPQLRRPLIGLIALSPLICLPFIRTVAYSEMAEYTYVRELVDEIPPGCTVIEYVDTDGYPELRFSRVGSEYRGGEIRPRFNVVTAATAPMGAEMSSEVVELLRHPSECVYFFRGVSCFVGKEEHLPIAPVCEDIVQFTDWELVSERRVINRSYNLRISQNVPEPVDELRLGLYRLTGRASGEGGPAPTDAPSADAPTDAPPADAPTTAPTDAPSEPSAPVGAPSEPTPPAAAPSAETTP